MTRKTMTAILALSVAVLAAPALASPERGGGRGAMLMPALDFATIDADGDGAITLEEWRAHVTARMETRRAERIEARVASLMEADVDGDGLLSAEELTAHFEAMADEWQSRRAEGMPARGAGHGYRHADRHQRGEMRGHQRGEMRGQGMRQMGRGMATDPDERIVRSFQRIDRDGDGQITEAEFDRFVSAVESRTERRGARMERREDRRPRRGAAED